MQYSALQTPLLLPERSNSAPEIAWLQNCHHPYLLSSCGLLWSLRGQTKSLAAHIRPPAAVPFSPDSTAARCRAESQRRRFVSYPQPLCHSGRTSWHPAWYCHAPCWKSAVSLYQDYQHPQYCHHQQPLHTASRPRCSQKLWFPSLYLPQQSLLIQWFHFPEKSYLHLPEIILLIF